MSYPLPDTWGYANAMGVGLVIASRLGRAWLNDFKAFMTAAKSCLGLLFGPTAIPEEMLCPQTCQLP